MQVGEPKSDVGAVRWPCPIWISAAEASLTCPVQSVVLSGGFVIQYGRRNFVQAVEEKARVGSEQSEDEIFDLVIGNLEQQIPPLASPTNSGSGTACGSCVTVYCC